MTTAAKKTKILATVRFDEAEAQRMAGVASDEARALLDSVSKTTIANDAEYHSFAEALFKAKGEAKKYSDQKDKIVAPMKQAMAEVTALFAPPLKFCAEAEAELKDAIRKYNVERERLRAADLLQAVKIQKVDPKKAKELIVRADDKLAPKIPGLAFQGNLKHEVVDESALPAEFWKRIPDDDKIKLAIVSGQVPPGVIVRDERIVKVTLDRQVGREGVGA